MIRVRSESLELAEPLVTAHGSIQHRECLLIRVDDPAGVGEAAPLSGWTEPLAEARSALEDLADGDAGGRLQTQIEAVTDLPATRHGLSLAALDRTARQREQPLYKLLGGERDVQTIPVNATIGDGDREATVTAAETAASGGFRCLKIKVGNRALENDIDRIRAVRERLPEIDLRLDANGAWTSDEARRAIDRLAPLDIEYLEQPLSPRNITGHETLVGRVDIALDESMRFVDRDRIGSLSVDTVVIKPMVIGGVDRARKLAMAAREADISVVISNTVDGVVGRTAAAHLAASLAPVPPCGLATASRLREDYAPDPAPVETGGLTVPDGPGHGVEVAW